MILRVVSGQGTDITFVFVALAFLCIPVLMIAMAIGVFLFVPEHSGKELNEIIE